MSSITVEAVFEDGVLRPVSPLPLSAQQRVTLIVKVPDPVTEWPEDTEEIYAEIAEEDRRLAGLMEPGIKETWPKAMSSEALWGGAHCGRNFLFRGGSHGVNRNHS